MSSLRNRYGLLWLVLISVLAGCSGHTTRVINTPETRELEGWQKPYEVDGARYHPLRDYSGFQQRGIASWYGRKFHGRKTSNGEIYDMYGKTAAHKTLPLGVYVKVTHLGNHRQIVVRINDRGPFVGGRIIDLSYGAARQLGIVDSGTAHVLIQALGYQQTDQSKTSPPVATVHRPSRFAAQVGAFTDAVNAQLLVGKLREHFGDVEISPVIRQGQQVYRVRVGAFGSLQQAEKAVQELIFSGYAGSYVVAFD